MIFTILLIVIVVILIVWWALMRNSRKYTANLPTHAHEEHSAPAETHAAETAAASAMRSMEIAIPAGETAVTAEGSGEHVGTGESAESTESGVPAPADQPFATDFGEPVSVEAGAQRLASGAMTMPDDLELLEGIGPRVKQVLGEVGIHSFADLAAADISVLRQALDNARLHFLDPGTWSEQAKLASEGRLEELQALMSTLRGGRRVD